MSPIATSRVMKAPPMVNAIRWATSNAPSVPPPPDDAEGFPAPPARRRAPGVRVVLLDPGGVPFTQAVAERLAGCAHVVILCGRYEGVDERVRARVSEEVSIGDYVLTGGELPARGRDVGAAVLSDGGVCSEPLQQVTELRHAALRRSLRGPARGGVQRDQVDVRRGMEAAREHRELLGVAVGVVHPVYQCPFERDSAVLLGEVLAARVHQHLDGVPLVDGHQFVPQVVACRMEGHREVHRQWPVRECLDAGHDADGADGEVAR